MDDTVYYCPACRARMKLAAINAFHCTACATIWDREKLLVAWKRFDKLLGRLEQIGMAKAGTKQ